MQSMQGMHWAHLTVQYGDIFLHVAKRLEYIYNIYIYIFSAAEPGTIVSVKKCQKS